MKLLTTLTDSAKDALAKEIGPLMFDETVGAKDQVIKILNSKTFQVSDVRMGAVAITLELSLKK